MIATDPFDIFIVTAPGLEGVLAEEVAELGLPDPKVLPGGVETRANWPGIWAAHLRLRGAARILVRIAQFRAMHPAQLDKRARKVDWARFLVPGTTVKVEASCRKSRIYHAGAAASRVEKAIVDGAGAKISAKGAVVVKVRIDDDLCTISLDATGEAMHKRGHKLAVGKAPMRENMAALFLRKCGFDGREPVLDPMCGSGTFVLEAAEMAAGLLPGRSRGFAFEALAGFDPEAYGDLRQRLAPGEPPSRIGPFGGYDRDAGAIRSSTQNAEAAGIAQWTEFRQQPIVELSRPDTPPGLVIVNPPYGARIGNRKPLFALYATLGQRLTQEFSGWRVGLVTSDGGLAKATGLPWLPTEPPVAHGGLKVTLWRTDPLP